MIIIVNPHAGGGKALRRWNSVAPEIRRRYPQAEVHFCETREQASCQVSESVQRGRLHFVAAGGDGTVNDLLNAIMSLPPVDRHHVTLGAIGFGSSNDFHKPINSSRCIFGIPCLCDIASAERRDIGVIRLRIGEHTVQRFFLINASVGLTAEANRLFNAPRRHFVSLKRCSANLAIAHAVMRTLFAYADKPVTLSLDGTGNVSVHLTNLAILKSPFVSGSIRFPFAAQTTTGTFSVCLAHDLRRIERFRLLSRLLHGSLPLWRNVRSWQTPTLSVTSKEEFAVEFDGEVVQTDHATFSILPKQLQVCTC